MTNLHSRYLAMIMEIECFTDGLDFKDFTGNRAIYRAVERDFEIIGEAVKKLSPEFKSQYPKISW